MIPQYIQLDHPDLTVSNFIENSISLKRVNILYIALLYVFAPYYSGSFQMLYSRTSMTQTLMAHSSGLARTIIRVFTGRFWHNPPCMARTTPG